MGSHRYEQLQEVLVKDLERAISLTDSVRGFKQGEPFEKIMFKGVGRRIRLP